MSPSGDVDKGEENAVSYLVKELRTCPSCFGDGIDESYIKAIKKCLAIENRSPSKCRDCGGWGKIWVEIKEIQEPKYQAPEERKGYPFRVLTNPGYGYYNDDDPTKKRWKRKSG